VVTVFCAASLHRALADAAQSFERTHPALRVQLEPSGSLAAARKISDLGLRADLVVLADALIIDRLLVPAHATSRIDLATNEVVLAHKDHSPFTDEVSAKNWPEVLLRPRVRLGRADPDLAPLGYHTILVWELAARGGTPGASADLAARLKARVPPNHVAADETELWSLLEARAIDYAFLYRSTAEDHRLKTVTLPDGLNLSRPALAGRYASVATLVRAKGKGETMRVVGHPITCGLTIPKVAANPAGGRAFVDFLLSREGQDLLRRRGFHPVPARRDR